MTTKEIFDKWLWKTIDYDKAYNIQCTDWSRQFAKEQWSPIGTFSGSALKWWQTGSPFVGTEWKRVENSPTSVPKQGSIIFFDKTTSNPYGHVAVVDSADVNNITLVEQNAGSGNWDWLWANAITRRTVKYIAGAGRGKCLGWYEMPIKKPILEEDISLLNTEERIYREEVMRTGIQWVFIDHKWDEPITKWQVKSLIDTAVVRIIERLQK